MISFLVAMDQNRLIGSNNQLPWHLPEDLKFFKRITMGHPIVMGRKTYQSIGKVLPGRENIVITRVTGFDAKGCTILHSIEELLTYSNLLNEEIFVIGGAEIFQQTFPYADRLYITFIAEEFAGDTYFPPFEEQEWSLTSAVKGIKDEKNPYEYEFRVYDRVRK
jgi:dihydrofolate reductase